MNSSGKSANKQKVQRPSSAPFKDLHRSQQFSPPPPHRTVKQRHEY